MQGMSNQFLTFYINNEKYAFDIMKVKEVIEVPTLTTLPGMSQFLCGVINLRGTVVPVVDLRLKFSFNHKEYDINSAIIIVEVPYDNSRILMGALSDSVSQVVHIPESEIEPAPKVGVNIKRELVRGLGKQGEEFIVILNEENLFSKDEIEAAMSVDNASSMPEEK